MVMTRASVPDWAVVATACEEHRAMRFRVLGPLEIDSDDGPVVVSGQRPRALLTALLLRPNTVVSADRLVDALWGEDPPESPANALHQVVTRLRARLGPWADCLRTEPGGYLLVAPDGSIDADEFELNYRRARALMDADPERAARMLDEALVLWRGPAYDQFASGFAQVSAVRMEELRMAALEDRVELLLRRGAATDAVAEARDLVAAEPLRERRIALLMRALYADGRVADALDAYRDHRRLLAEELGLDSPPGLRDLEARILRDDLPAPRPLGRRASADSPPPRPGLPRRPGGMVGREQELDLLLECLTTERLVTLVGPGGVGKTRLALEAAHRFADQGRQVFWSDLSVVTPDRLVDALAEVTGVVMPRGEDPGGELGASLRGSSAMLCLDNAETVLGELAPVVEAVGDTAPGLLILATSRERLGVVAEHVHQLAPLPLPSGPDPDNPAIRLFLERAWGLEGTLSDDNLDDIAELCRRLDGLPLAIELGAARAPTFGIREFAAHIAGELDLLAGGRRTAAVRHRTLRTVVDASYQLLTPEEALLFERLAVFPGPFRLAQARTVCADDRLRAGTVGPVLARLVEQSLVQAADGVFHLLDTLRTYAAERLPAPDRSHLRARHAREVADRIRERHWQQRPDTEPECVAALSQMTADLHQAWDHAVHHDRDLAVELAGLIYDFAYQRQRLDLLDWGLQVATWDVRHPMQAQAQATAAAAAWATGELKRAEEITVSCIRSAEVTGRPASGRTVGQAGNLAMFAGDFDAAITRFGQAERLNRAEGRDLAALMCEVSACQAMTYAGMAAEARKRLVDLRQRAYRSRNPSAIAWTYYVTGEATADTDLPAALAAYRASVEQSLKTDNRLFLGLARSSAVALAARRGPPHDALTEFERVMTEWDELGNVAAQWWVLQQISMLLTRLRLDRPAALLAGAFLANGTRTYMLLGDEDRLRASIATLTARLGEQTAQATLAEGAALGFDDVVSLARRTITAARHREPTGPSA
jgi:predicted ATPase/DNA-binding SARP family transcriptional activator